MEIMNPVCMGPHWRQLKSACLLTEKPKCEIQAIRNAKYGFKFYII